MTREPLTCPEHGEELVWLDEFRIHVCLSCQERFCKLLDEQETT